MTRTITTEYAGVTYTAEIEPGQTGGTIIRIYADGVGAGQGFVEDDNIVCAAHLPEEVYEALEAQLVHGYRIHVVAPDGDDYPGCWGQQVQGVLYPTREAAQAAADADATLKPDPYGNSCEWTIMEA